jgi:hypothetical protein
LHALRVTPHPYASWITSAAEGAELLAKPGVSLRDLQQLMDDPPRSWRTASSSGGLRIDSGS